MRLSNFFTILLPSLVHSSAIVSLTTPHQPSIPLPTPATLLPHQTPTPSPAANVNLQTSEILTNSPTTPSAPLPSQAPTVTTLWMPSGISGTVKWVEVIFTLTFPAVPSEMPLPSSGSIGLGMGTLTGVERAVQTQTGGAVGGLRGKERGVLLVAVLAVWVVMGFLGGLI